MAAVVGKGEKYIHVHGQREEVSYSTHNIRVE